MGWSLEALVGLVITAMAMERVVEIFSSPLGNAAARWVDVDDRFSWESKDVSPEGVQKREREIQHCKVLLVRVVLFALAITVQWVLVVNPVVNTAQPQTINWAESGKTAILLLALIWALAATSLAEAFHHLIVRLQRLNGRKGEPTPDAKP